MPYEQSLQIKAPAKVNLCLAIIGQRADGYHLLNSLMQKISLYDVLRISLVEGRGVSISGSEATLPYDESNIVWQAATLFFEAIDESLCPHQRKIIVNLEKNIPVAAGLGGGSSDGAAMLRGLNKLFSYPFSNEELSAMGLVLGADVPFFIQNSGTCWAEGVGELLSPMETIKNLTFVLVNPGFRVSTKWVYDNFALTKNEKNSNLENSRVNWTRLWLGSAVQQQFPADQIYNDLEAVTAAEYPEINFLKDELLKFGAIAAMMSGSGPTVFGVFEQQETAEKCRELLSKAYHFVCTATPLS